MSGTIQAHVRNFTGVMLTEILAYFRAMKSSRTRCEANVTSVRNRRVSEGEGGKHEGKRPTGRPRHRWKGILKWIFKEIG
jgi:hypothetical protein